MGLPKQPPQTPASQEISRLYKLIKALVLPQDQAYVDLALKQIEQHKADIRDAKPLTERIKGLVASLERDQIKRTNKLDLIASTQMEVVQLEAKMTENNTLLISLKQQHLAELQVHLPAPIADPAAPTMAAFTALTQQLHNMMGILGQIAGTPGIDPSMAASIQQVVQAHPAMRNDNPQPLSDPAAQQEQALRQAQFQQAQLQQAQLQQAQLQQAQHAATERALSAAQATPLPRAEASMHAANAPPVEAGAITHIANAPPAVPQSWMGSELPVANVGVSPNVLHNAVPLSPDVQHLALSSPSLLQFSPEQQAAAAARTLAMEQIVAGSQSATRDRSRSRHSAASSDSEEESCTIIKVVPPAVVNQVVLAVVPPAVVNQQIIAVTQPVAPLFQLGGQDA